MDGMRTSRMMCAFLSVFMIMGLPTASESELSVALPAMIAFGFGWLAFDYEIRKACQKQDD